MCTRFNFLVINEDINMNYEKDENGSIVGFTFNIKVCDIYLPKFNGVLRLKLTTVLHNKLYKEVLDNIIEIAGYDGTLDMGNVSGDQIYTLKQNDRIATLALTYSSYDSFAIKNKLNATIHVKGHHLLPPNISYQ